MSQSQEENGQPTENSETEDNSQEDAPQDEDDSQEDVDSQEDMEGTEEPPQSEESDVLVPVEPTKKQRPASVDPNKKQRPVSVDSKKKQRPVSVDPKKTDVPKVQSNSLQSTKDGAEEDEGKEKGCCGCKVPWSRWEELIISYLHIVIAVSSGMAGAGLNNVVETFEELGGQNVTVDDQGPTGNATTGCEDKGYLSRNLHTIVATIYSVIVALFIAQVITLIALGSKRQYSHAKLVFTILRGMITLFTTVYFIIGWTGALGCVTLNYFAIATTCIEVVLTGVEWYKEVGSLGKVFMKEFFPKTDSNDKEEALNIM